MMTAYLVGLAGLWIGATAINTYKRVKGFN